jgi:hypothetical protein
VAKNVRAWRIFWTIKRNIVAAAASGLGQRTGAGDFLGRLVRLIEAIE